MTRNLAYKSTFMSSTRKNHFGMDIRNIAKIEVNVRFFFILPHSAYPNKHWACSVFWARYWAYSKTLFYVLSWVYLIEHALEYVLNMLTKNKKYFDEHAKLSMLMSMLNSQKRVYSLEHTIEYIHEHTLSTSRIKTYKFLSFSLWVCSWVHIEHTQKKSLKKILACSY